GRGPGREAERGDGPDAGGRRRGVGVRLRRRRPAFRAGVPRQGAAGADVRRWAGGGEAADDRLPERRTRKDTGLPAAGDRDIRARGREGNLETMTPLRIAGLGLLLPIMMPAQQWPVHSMDRPRPPVVQPGGGPEQPSVPPPSDAVVLFDGKDRPQWMGPATAPAKWLVKDGYMEVVAGAG